MTILHAVVELLLGMCRKPKFGFKKPNRPDGFTTETACNLPFK